MSDSLQLIEIEIARSRHTGTALACPVYFTPPIRHKKRQEPREWVVFCDIVASLEATCHNRRAPRYRYHDTSSLLHLHEPLKDA